MMNRKFLMFILVITAIYFLNNAKAQDAQDITVKASVNKEKLAQDEDLTFKIEITGNFKKTPEIELPDLGNFYVLSSIQSQNYSFLRDRTSQFKTTLQYILRPRIQGKLTIGPIVVKDKSKRYESNPITIEVGPPKRPIPQEPEEEPAITEEGIIL